MIRVLMVCHGNICRSPMAEFVMKDIVKKAGKEADFIINSAATSTEEIGNDIYPPAKRKLTEKGIPFTARAARQITKADYNNYDLIIGMDNENRRNLLRIFSNDPDNKVSNLMDHTSSPRSVADPWYTGDFEETWNDVLEGCTALFNELDNK